MSIVHFRRFPSATLTQASGYPSIRRLYCLGPLMQSSITTDSVVYFRYCLAESPDGPLIGYFGDIGALMPSRLAPLALRTLGHFCEIIGSHRKVAKTECANSLVFICLEWAIQKPPGRSYTLNAQDPWASLGLPWGNESMTRESPPQGIGFHRRPFVLHSDIRVRAH